MSDRITRMKQSRRDIYNIHQRLGSDFNNDKRFSRISYKLRDEIRALERAIDKVESHINDIKRASR